jgi:hypothetical protein
MTVMSPFRILNADSEFCYNFCISNLQLLTAPVFVWPLPILNASLDKLEDGLTILEVLFSMIFGPCTIFNDSWKKVGIGWLKPKSRVSWYFHMLRSECYLCANWMLRIPGCHLSTIDVHMFIFIQSFVAMRYESFLWLEENYWGIEWLTGELLWGARPDMMTASRPKLSCTKIKGRDLQFPKERHKSYLELDKQHTANRSLTDSAVTVLIAGRKVV